MHVLSWEGLWKQVDDIASDHRITGPAGGDESRCRCKTEWSRVYRVNSMPLRNRKEDHGREDTLR